MNFSLILFIALLVTGLIWLWDLIIGAPHRAAAAAVSAGGEASGTGARAPVKRREPVLVEYAKSFFPVILLVFVLRSFIIEPFRIPSGSMMPTLENGDFILVSKFSYGIRLPIINTKILDTGSPHRGDVMVFRFPHNEKIDYIKRVIGLPGDLIVYNDKQLTINGKPVPIEKIGDYRFDESGNRDMVGVRYDEKLPGEEHDILLDSRRPDGQMEFRVPPGHYFVMGDNRDHSNDSRYWGFVPDANIVGRAFLIWFNWDIADGHGVSWGRIGDIIH